MKELDLSRGLIVRTFGFNVPCRRFMLAAKVTRDRRMPLVDEFVLRALRVTEQLTVGRLAGFFGFSINEVQTVVADLVSRSLVTVSDEHIHLHSAAQEMFRTSRDGVPTVMEVESWVEVLWFDLISGSMIPNGIRRGTNFVDIKPPASHESVSTDFARQAFEENFRDYLMSKRKINDPDAFSLYAVTDVQPTQYGHVAIAGSEELILFPHPKLQPSLPEVEGNRAQRARKLTEAMRTAYDALRNPSFSAAAQGEYCRLTDSTSLQDAISSNGYLDLERWQRLEYERRAEGVVPLIGAAYLERNRQLLRVLIEQSTSVEPSRELEVVWLRPSGSAWGASDDLRALLAEIRATTRVGAGRRLAVRTTLVVPAAERTSHPRRFKKLFEQGILAPPGYLPPALEVLLVRGRAAFVLVWVQLSESCGVWVGRATNRPSDIAAIEDQLRLAELTSNSKPLWPERRD
ncbi:MAG: hypothetical protein ACYCST_02355 [Acidimicrobiales bacterium]